MDGQGFYEKYNVERKDGKEVGRPTFTLECDGHDPHALVALAAYADSVRSDNPDLADQLEAHVNSLNQ